MPHHINIDIETYSSVPIARAGLYKYAQSPDFEILLFSYSIDGGPRPWILQRGRRSPSFPCCWIY